MKQIKTNLLKTPRDTDRQLEEILCNTHLISTDLAYINPLKKTDDQ